MSPCHLFRRKLTLKPRTHGNVFLRFCIVSSNELVVLNSLENSKQYKNENEIVYNNYFPNINGVHKGKRNNETMA